MATKKTVVQMYEELLAINGLTQEQKDFLAKRIEITKKKNASGKDGEPTPKQKEKMAHNALLCDKVVSAMTPGVSYHAGDIVKLVDVPDIPNTQKLTPLLTSLVSDGRLTKAVEKGRSVYSLPADTADEG